MRATLLRGALLALAACGRRQEGEPAVDLPPLTTAVAVEPPGPDSVTITLTKDGRILARGRAWSIEGLEGLLRASVRHQGQWHASTVVRLRIDRAAPWIQVRWLVHTALVCLVHELRFVYRDDVRGEVDVRSTVSSWIGEPAAKATFVDVVRLRVVVDAGGRMRCGERVAGDPSIVSTWTAEAGARVREDGLSGVRGSIAPRDGTPWGTVAAVYERLRSGGATPLHFAGSERRPEDDVRGLDRLPRPDARVAGRAADGSSDAGGMKVRSVWGAGGSEFEPGGDEWDELPIEEPEPLATDDPGAGK